MSQQITLPIEAKIAVGVAAVAVGMGSFLIIRHLVNKSKEKKEDKKNQEETAAVIANEAEQWTAQGQQPTLPLLQYKSLADQIETAVNQPWYDPTDEDSIYDAVGQLKNNRDWLELVSAYGNRDGYTLQTAIQGDMDTEERANVNNILQSKGIVYRV